MAIVRAAQMKLSDADLARAADLFGAKHLESLGGFENALFRTEPGGFVVRLTHPSRRSVELIEGELAFMDHLSGCDVPVVAPLRSRNGAFVEELPLDDGETLIAICMSEAPGDIRRPGDWSEDEIESYGALLGTMHVAARDFAARDSHRRPKWYDPILDVGHGDEGVAPPEILARNAEIMEAARAHRAATTDLLIHHDAHFGNLFLTDDGRITIFDFDDAAYSSPTHDIAILLFYWMVGRDIDPVAETRSFLTPFLTGYERHARLPDDWSELADIFLSYRELDIYWLLGLEPGSSETKDRFMVGRRERILEGVPYLGVPLSQIL